MKILIFMTQFYLLGGAESLAVELAVGLNKRGIHADVLCMYTEDMQGVAEAKQNLLDRGIPNIRFLGLKIHPRFARLVPAALKLRKTLLTEKYDIVETSMMSPSVIASWATLGTRVRHVSGIHQVFQREYSNGLTHKFWRFSVRCNPRNRYYAITDCVAKHWFEYSSTSPKKTRLIYNSISAKFFNATQCEESVRAELQIPEEERIALYVGRMARYKGCDVLLDALGPILKQERLHLLYVGGPDYFQGYELLIHEMQDKVEKEGWGDRVHFLGIRKDTTRLFSSADLLVHPTLTEGFGLVLAEAMAMGLPVVATNVDGIPEVLSGTQSRMVDPKDTKAFRAAVLETLRLSSKEHATVIALGRQKAEAFRADKRLDEMFKLFEDVLSEQF